MHNATSTPHEIFYLALCLEGFFFGLYSGIFTWHLQIHAKEADSRKQDIVFHALWVLYVLSAAVIALDIVLFVIYVINHNVSMTYHLITARPVVFACCDFIAQSIIIHRCWVMWSGNIRVVIIPSILAFAFLVMWIATSGALFIGQGVIVETEWGNTLGLTGLTASMTVNALVTGLIVFRIFKVFRAVKTDKTSLGITDGRKLRSIIFIIIESGMALFSIQLARLVLASSLFRKFKTATTAEYYTYELIIGIHEMVNGITPTIILVRVSMGLSFRDEPSLVEAVSSLQFAADHLNPIVGTGSFSEDGIELETDDLNANLEVVNISQERRDNDDGSDEIQIIDR